MTEPDLTADLANLETELDELLEERRRQLARPMRGAVRDQLRRQFDRAEERLRARIAELAVEVVGALPQHSVLEKDGLCEPRIAGCQQYGRRAGDASESSESTP